MKISDYKKPFVMAFLAAILHISGCTENIREAPANTITKAIEHLATPDDKGLAWFAPELHNSQYRTLFFGYDTLDYRLAAPEHADGNNISLLFNVNYGGNVRHYDIAKAVEGTSHTIQQQKHHAVRCQLFNSLISSCLYEGQFSLTLSRSDLAQISKNGLQLQSINGSQRYEHIDLPAEYIQGFLNAIKLN